MKWTLIQVDATSSSVLSCSPAQVLTKSGFSLGAKDVPENCATLATGEKKRVDNAAAPTLPDYASTARSYSLGATTSDLTEVGATDLSSLRLSPWGVVTERDAADGNAHCLAHCARTAPPSGIGASTGGLISVMVPKMANGLFKITIREEVPVQWTLIQVAATSLSKPSSSLAEVVLESGSFSVAKDVPEDGVTLATGQNGDEDATEANIPDYASTPRSCRICASTWDLTKVGVTDTIALPSSVVRVVTERDAADGYAHALENCAGTAPPSGIGVLTVVLVSAVKLTIVSNPGKMTIGEEVAVERTLIQVDATSLSVPSSSIAEVVTETRVHTHKLFGYLM